MNNIFKVIWSKTKNSYVVVSEIAKRNGKCSSSMNKKLIAAFLAAGTVLSVTGSAWAADTVKVNGDEDATATGDVTIAVGNAATVNGKNSIGFGNKANVQGTYAIAIGDAATVNTGNAEAHSIAFGNKANVQGTYAIAIGKNASVIKGADNTAAISIGTDATANNNSAIAIGNRAEAKTTGNNHSAMAIGASAKASGDSAVAIGHLAKASDSSSYAIGYGAKVSKEQGVAIGTLADVSGGAGLAIGQWTKSSGESAIALGHASESGGSHSIAIGESAKALDSETIKIGSASSSGGVAGFGSVAIGNSSTAIGQYYSTATGYRSLALNSYATTYGSVSSASEGSVALGAFSYAGTKAGAVLAEVIPGVTQATAIGYYSMATGHRSTATGAYSRATGDYSTADGFYGQATGTKATAIGYYSKADKEGAIALGADSIADRAAGEFASTDSGTAVNGKNAYDPSASGQIHDKNDTSPTWVSTAGAVSVGSAENKLTRQITNVAAGSAETDAVNVAQLKAAVDSVEGVHDYHVKSISPATDTNYNNTGATGNNALAAGVSAKAQGHYSAVVGDKSEVLSTERTYTVGMKNPATGATITRTVDQSGVQGVGAVNVGAMNIVGAADDNAYGFDGVANSIVGVANKTEKANGAIIMGAGNVITNSYDDEALKDALKKNAQNLLKEDPEAYRKLVKDAGGDVLAIGGANTADYAVKSSMIGVKNTIKGTDSIEEFNSAIGYNNSIENGSNNSIIGTNRKISGKDGIIVIGSALKEELTTSEANAVVIGTNANVGVEDGVALGSGSVTSYKVSESSGYDVRTGDARTGGDSATATWLPTLGEVSVGGNGATRRITNVAAGSNPTDAVNVAQLATSRVEIKAGDNITVATSIAADGHAIYTLSSSPETVVAQGTNVTVDGPTSSTTGGDTDTGNDTTDGGTTESGTYTTNTYTVNAANSKVTEVAVTKGTPSTTGNKTETKYTIAVTSEEQDVKDGKIDPKPVTVTKTDEFTITDVDTKYTAKQETEEGSTTFTVSEVDGEDVGVAKLIAGENVQITKGEDGSAIISAQAGGGMTEISFNGDNKDAQIDNPKVLNIDGGATGELTDGNIGVESDGKDTLTVKLAKDIKGVDNITVNKTVKVGDNTTIEGDKITVGDTIVEGDQITTKTVNTDTINLGDTTIEEGDDNRITYKKGGDTYNIATLEDGLTFEGDKGSADVKLTKVTKIYGGATDSASSDNITVEAKSDGNDGAELKINLAKDIKGVDNITVNETVKVGDNTTIEGDQITTKTVNADTFKAGDTTINNDGLTINEGPSVTKEGIDAGNKTITNVAPGTLDTDAATVGQLKNESGDIRNEISRLDDRTQKGLAGAAALAALHPMDFNPDDKMQFSAGFGHYRGQNAAAIGAFYRPDESVMFSIGGVIGNGDNMINAGITFGLDGTRNRITRSRTAMAREIQDLRSLVTQMAARMDRLEGANAETAMFPDVPENHWAYEYVEDLQKRGALKGYPDGLFKGDRAMTRYEFAAMLDRLVRSGVTLDSKIAKEFEPELGRIYVERISGQDNDRNKIERVRVNNSDSKYPEGKNRDVYGSKIQPVVSEKAAGE